MAIVAYGEAGGNPAARKSFLITEDLTNTKQLDHWLVKEFQEFDAQSKFQIKTKLIQILATIARKLHENGVNHRDFYLCHFLARLPIKATMTGAEIKLHLIDLHRAQIRTSTPKRWLIKDLAGLYFSSMELAGMNVKFTGRDYFRFIIKYTGLTLRDALTQKPEFWQTVHHRACQLYKKQQKKLA
jgi:heptose I phosphotransferase